MSYIHAPIGAILTSGKAFSYREGMNIIYHGKLNRLNWRFGRMRGPVVEAVRANVRAVLEEDAPGWLTRYPEYSIAVRPGLEPGAYHYVVYNETEG